MRIEETVTEGRMEEEVYAAESVREEAEAILERLVALLQEARLLAEGLREAASRGERERMARLGGGLQAVAGEMRALDERVDRCLRRLPPGTDFPALARLLDRGGKGEMTDRLELAGRLAAEVLQLQTANEKLFFLLEKGSTRFLDVLAEASGRWVPYGPDGSRKWSDNWTGRSSYSL
ncbi:MAG: hypothetical protein WHT46_07430 [Candidatus Geothermincolales bacterium]